MRSSFSMFLLYHVLLCLRFLISACTIYILTSMILLDLTGVRYTVDMKMIHVLHRIFLNQTLTLCFLWIYHSSPVSKNTAKKILYISANLILDNCKRMEKPKTLEQLRAEKERAETRLAQEQHKLNRLENRKKFLEQGERKKRTHRLCNLGGTVESLAPVFKDLSRTEMTGLMEHIFALPEVEQALREAMAAHERNLHR